MLDVISWIMLAIPVALAAYLTILNLKNGGYN